VTIQRLPETVHTLYAELLDQVVEAEAVKVVRGWPPFGSFVSKQVRGKAYWYLQQTLAGRREQRYLGPDSPSLRRWMERVRETREERSGDDRRRAELVDMLLAGGAVRGQAATDRVVGALAEAGVFRLGGVLVGSQAFLVYGNMLGVRFDARHLRTQDVDLAQDPRVEVAFTSTAERADVQSALTAVDDAFFGVPGLDPRRPSTSFKVRGRDLRVDFLTPRRRADSEEPIPLPRFGVAAHPLPFLGYQLEDTEQSVLLYRSGALVTVPTPARFALYKLWLAGERPSAQQARVRKDLLQAEALIEVLLEDRPEDLRRAWGAVRGGRRQQMQRQLARLESGVQRTLEGILGDG